MFNQVFSLVFKNCLPNEYLRFFLQVKTSQDIAVFNVPNLPAEYHIEIEVLPYQDFISKMRNAKLPAIIHPHCIAYSDSSIHCVDFASISKLISHEDYLKSIRHECIHILQHLTTKIQPQSAVWLYEAIACALAEQSTPTPRTAPSWKDFVTNFYEHPNCYALAYTFGVKLLEYIAPTILAEQCKNFNFFTKECEAIYCKIFSK